MFSFEFDQVFFDGNGFDTISAVDGATHPTRNSPIVFFGFGKFNSTKGRLGVNQFGPAIDSNQGLPLTGFVSASGSTLAIDFGAAGLGASRNTNLADGYYTLGLDLDGDGVFESSRRFYRLLGDVNGDRQVNTTDVSLVNAGMTTAYNSVLDINGDGVVNASDLMFVNRAKGRKLADGLLLD